MGLKTVRSMPLRMVLISFDARKLLRASLEIHSETPMTVSLGIARSSCFLSSKISADLSYR